LETKKTDHQQEKSTQANGHEVKGKDFNRHHHGLNPRCPTSDKHDKAHAMPKLHSVMIE